MIKTVNNKMHLPNMSFFFSWLLVFVSLFLLLIVLYFIDSVHLVLFVPYVLLSNSLVFSASSQCHSPFHSFSQSQSSSLISPCLRLDLTHSSVHHAVTPFVRFSVMLFISRVLLMFTSLSFVVLPCQPFFIYIYIFLLCI